MDGAFFPEIEMALFVGAAVSPYNVFDFDPVVVMGLVRTTRIHVVDVAGDEFGVNEAHFFAISWRFHMWRGEWDSNPRSDCSDNCLVDSRSRPLSDPPWCAIISVD